MKALAVFPGTNEIRVIEDHPEPHLATATQVKLRMLDVGICGTDKEICHFDYGTPPAGSPYLVLGHESLGEVVEVGVEVSGLKVGDLVVTMVRRPCEDPACFACRNGRQDFCLTGNFKERGIKEYHGFMTEFVVDEAKYMFPVPAELREFGVLTEPLTIAEKALTELMQIQQRMPWGCPVQPGQAPQYCHNAIVLGAGPVGLLGAMALVNTGFKTYVYSREPEGSEKAKLVASIDCTYVSGETHNVEQLAGVVGQVDVVYEATGASGLSFEMIKYLGTNGVFIFTGVPGRKHPIEVDTDVIMRNLVLKNQVVFGSVNAGRDAYTAAIKDLGDFAKKWPAAVKSLITGHYQLDNFKDLLLGNPPGIKNVMQIGT
ncbi:MAG: glucose 1-dehydrogenase [Chthoniobacteraceae bacterium]